MSELMHLFDNNRRWSAQQQRENPQFFNQLAKLQSPHYLWIGCSDSRVPANQITGLKPGEVFVHRNIGNLVVHSDLNCLSVLQYAVDILKVRHILVVGHYGCGGVNAALNRLDLGLADNWIRHIRDVHYKHYDGLNAITDAVRRLDVLCELNAIEQATNVSHTTVIRAAWARGQPVSIHAWAYGLHDGLIVDLGCSIAESASIKKTYDQAIAAVFARAASQA